MQRILVGLGIFLLLILVFNPAPRLPAAKVMQVVRPQVSSLLFQKAVFDPIWEALFGNADIERLRALKSDLVPIITEGVINALPASAHASDGSYPCERLSGNPHAAAS